MGLIKTDEPDTIYNLPYTDYNAAHWDGSEWAFIKVLSGHTANTGILYFSENDSLQFMERVDGVGYPLLVSNKRNLLNKELKDDRKNSKQGDIN